MKKLLQHPELLIGLLLLIAGTILAVCTYRTSYQESVSIGKEIKEINAALSDSQEEKVLDREVLLLQKDELTEAKLSKERPYSYSLILVFFGVLLTAKGILSLINPQKPRKLTTSDIAITGLMAALCYIGFAFFKFDIPVGTEKTSFHFGNVFCVLASLLLGGYLGGLSGAVGMTIGDLTTAYVTSAPKTFFLKMCIGLITGFVAHRICKLDKASSRKKTVLYTVLSAFSGMAFNVVADPIVGYFYKTYLLGIPQDLAKALAKLAALTTSVNAVVAVIFASLFYLALRPALKKSGLLP